MILDRYGDIIELNYSLNTEQAIKELRALDVTWKTEKTRQYVDFIGDPFQDYSVKDSTTELNSLADVCPTIRDYIKLFPDVHKARVQRLDTGSFFEPHRDHFQGGKRFRVFMALNNVELQKYAFFYDGSIYTFKAGVPYIINTAKVHGSMSFADETYHLLLSVNTTDQSTRAIIDRITFQ